MKKLQLLLLTLLIPFLGYTQNSWIHIQLMTDDYPSETSWNITPPGGSPIIIENDSNMLPNTMYDTIVQLGGTIIAGIYDSFGDGLGSSQWGGTDGWFMISNSCQDTLMYVAGNFGDSLIQTLTVAPCAPPTVGCTDPSALNYDSTAYISDPSSCTFSPCQGLLTSTASQNCLPGGQTLVIFNWTLDSNTNCTPVKFWYSNEDGVGPFQYGLGPNALDFAVYAGNGQMPPNWSVEHYGQVEFLDGTLSDTIFYTPTACIAGCTDPTQISYNPWATYDDGSCAGTSCDTATEYQITMEITLDNWPGETSWIMNSLGVIDEAIPGTYDFNDIGQTYTYTFCIDQNAGFELVVNDTYGDGMAGSTSGGSMDGMIVIYDCNGDTIWYMDNPGFGSVLYSGQQFAVPCPTIPPVLGCTDDDYVEFNPLANVDDSSCVTLHTYGCIDSTAFNYDPNATMMDLIPDCNYLLEIFDAAGDGWGNSYIGVYQNGLNLGTYTMGPGNYVNSWNIILDPGIPVEVFYFEVGGPQQPPQEVQFQTWHNSFKLTNADGFVLMHEGQNPFANNGQGALQSFESPFWTKYVDIPFCGNTCIPVVLGCMDPLAFNYDSTANVDDGSCIPYILGCMNVFAINFNPLANVDDGSCIPFINGCTDSTADNYNPLANTDDGSCYYIGCMDVAACNFDSTATVNNGCQYPVQYYDCNNVCLLDSDGDGICDELEIPGCTNPIALNFDITATDDDGTCILPIYGCTDPLAFNYDPLANTDNGSCVPVVYGCTDPTQFNYDPSANTDNGSCISYIYGCTDSTAFNYNSNANTDNGSCIPVVNGCIDSTAINYNPLANTNDGSCIAELLGCTDSTAINYNVLANTDDGSCIPTILGCTDATAFNYDPLANTDDGSCVPKIFGCTDPVMFNFDPLANVDDGSCVPKIYGCMDATAFNYDPLANTPNGSCIPVVFGCTDSTAFNYDPLANTDNGSCLGIIYGCTNPIALNYDPNANTDDLSCILPIYGCTDSTAFNYNPLANTDNGSCEAVVTGCTNPNALNYDPLANTDDGSCISFIYGCTDSTQFNYNPLANTDNGSCIPFIYGCTDAAAFNYDPLANTNDNSCCLIAGCTDPLAVNYNEFACFDDNSCITAVPGCTDVSAYNYNPAANVSDSTACLYDAGCYGGPGIPYWLNDECYAWVIDVDDYCCNNDWDPTCQSMYDYCQLGWPTSIPDVSALGIAVYPNPTHNVLSIDTRLDIQIEVHDLMGKLLIKTENVNRLDLSDLSNGLYNLSIIHESKRYNKQIIKQ